MTFRLLFRSLALVFAAALSSCVSNRPSAQIPLGNWEPEAARVASSTATPKHSLSRSEYPFDSQGNYIAAWAAGKVQEPAPAATPTQIPISTSQSLWASNPLSTSTPVTHTRTPSNAAARKPTKTAPLDSQATLAEALAKVDAAVGASAAPRTARASAPEPQPSSSANSRYHKVGSSDTLWGLSRKYGTTVAAIQRANGLSDSTIRTGSTLKIPG